MNRATAALWLFVVFSAAAFAAEPAAPGPAKSPPDQAALEAEVVQLRAEVNLLRRENARLVEEIRALKAGAAGVPVGDQSEKTDPAAPNPAAQAGPAPVLQTQAGEALWWTDLNAFVEHIRIQEALRQAKRDLSLSVARWLLSREALAGQKVAWRLPVGTSGRVWTKSSAEAEWHRIAAEISKKEEALSNIRQSAQASQTPPLQAEHLAAEVELDLVYTKALADLYHSISEAGGGATLECAGSDVTIVAKLPARGSPPGELFGEAGTAGPVVQGTIIAAKHAGFPKKARRLVVVLNVDQLLPVGGPAPAAIK